MEGERRRDGETRRGGVDVQRDNDTFKRENNRDGTGGHLLLHPPFPVTHTEVRLEPLAFLLNGWMKRKKKQLKKKVKILRD